MERLKKAFKLAQSGNITLYHESQDCLKFFIKKPGKKEQSKIHVLKDLDGEISRVEVENKHPMGYDVIFQKVGRALIKTCNCRDFYHTTVSEPGHDCYHILGCVMWVALEKLRGQTVMDDILEFKSSYKGSMKE